MFLASHLPYSSLILLLLLPCYAQSPASNETADHLALLAFKATITQDPLQALASWNSTSDQLCQWQGVTCGLRHRNRVTALNLDGVHLIGPISPSLANLTFLHRLHLPNNRLHGSIPTGLCNLPRLRYLNLSYNSLSGTVPNVIANLSSLHYLDFSYNNLTGNLPPSLGNLALLSNLDATGNNFSGGIPPSLGNLSSLNILRLTLNHFSGSIPPPLGSLSSLSQLALSHNNLSGAIPPTIYNISSIQHLGVSDNQLIGTLPSDIGAKLPRLQTLYMYYNMLHGPIPMSLANASGLTDIELTGNRFTGAIPSNIGNLAGLYWVTLDSNLFEAGDDNEGWSFLESLTNCSALQLLQLDSNLLGGTLPLSLANLSANLEVLTFWDNQIAGTLPANIDNLAGLTTLAIGRNFLTGSIPPSMGTLQRLQLMDLSNNNFKGLIPDTIGNLTALAGLYLYNNSLTGGIPATLGNCQGLQYLDLSYNKLTGPIPKEVVSISSLTRFLGLSNNFLNGSLPVEVGRLRNLMSLAISDNNLSGNIPSSIGECQVLQGLYLQNNRFVGTIPASVSNLKAILELDLSNNNLSGRIPQFLSSFRMLYNLNLSFNNFEGEVPRNGIFANSSGVSVIGNAKLCGGDAKLHLPPCNNNLEQGDRHGSLHLKIIIPVAVISLGAFLVMCSLLVAHRLSGSRRPSATNTCVEDLHTTVSYSDLLKATDGFSPANLLGVGSYGSVYRGTLDFGGERVVAVKVLKLQRQGASRTFMAECKALRNVRHRNLVKVITACSSVDLRGDDFKALVFEFMSNGSLEQWLHPGSETKSLSLAQRLNVAIDIAIAVDYLHCHGKSPIVHCDLKPSNVLLDHDLIAHVGDFGLSRFLTETVSRSFQPESESAGVKGTIGYVPPEYGMTSQVDTKGDVYSYGILLLEMFTGKRPTDDATKGLTLHKFVELASPEQVMDIIDPQLLLLEDEEESHAVPHETNGSSQRTELCLISVLRIGLACSYESPKERMIMADVVKELLAVRDSIVAAKTRGDMGIGKKFKAEVLSHIT